MTHKDVLYITENYTQCLVITSNGKEYKRYISIYKYMRVTEILKLTRHCKL